MANVTATYPASNALPVEFEGTDDFDLDTPSRGLWVGTGGDVTVWMSKGQEVTFTNVPDGSLLPVSVTSIIFDGTDAEDLVVLY